jgi:hypothetical protein
MIVSAELAPWYEFSVFNAGLLAGIAWAYILGGGVE